MIDLEAIFGDDAVPAAAVVLQGRRHRAADLGGAEPDLFADWVHQPDFRGRLRWEAPNVPEADRWWAVADLEDLPQPGGPCPRCGSMELWETIAGTWRCQHCDAVAFRRSLDLIELAARLRAAAPPRTAVQDCAGGAAGPRADTLDLGTDRAGTGHLRGPGGA